MSDRRSGVRAAAAAARAVHQPDAGETGTARYTGPAEAYLHTVPGLCRPTGQRDVYWHTSSQALLIAEPVLIERLHLSHQISHDPDTQPPETSPRHALGPARPAAKSVG